MPSSRQNHYRNGTAAFQFELRRTRRRTIGLTVYPGGRLRVHAPRHAPREAIMRVLHDREAWILRKMSELAAIPPREAPVWEEGMTVPLLGRELRLVVETRPVGGGKGGGAAPTRRACVHLSRGTLRVYPGPLDTTATAPGSTLQRLVLAWYRERACQVFAHRLAVLRRDPRIAALGRPGTLGVRRMRRRWGSCFRDGRITLNIELLAEPLPLVDYVIVHELCHLREHNHSPRFYRLMDEVMPDWRTRREALRRSTTAGFLAGP